MAIRIKNASQIERIRKAGSIVAGCFEMIKPHLKSGVTTKQLDEILNEFIVSQGGTSASKGYGGFPGYCCISVNEELIHGIPKSSKVLKDGDIVSFDIMVWYEKCVADAARTFVVGETTEEVQRLLDVTQQSFFEGIKEAKAGNHINDIGTAIQKYVESNGYGVIREFIGHGVGIEVHEDPEVPNYNTGYKGARLTPGMVIAVEPMVSMGSPKIKILKDDWTVVMRDGKMCSHYENTILVTEGDPVILTLKEEN